jgi:hypothetical protein
MYSLKDETGNYLIAEVEGNRVFSVWPAIEFAIICAPNWDGYSPEEISLDDFSESISPSIRDKNYLINVFSVENTSGFVVS